MPESTPAPLPEPAPTLGALQGRVADLLAPVAHPRLGAALALAEEAGELCRVVLDHEVYGRPLDRPALAGELADVLVSAAELATRYEIDLERAMADKLADLERRVPGWAETLGPALARARARLDGPPPP